MVRSRKRKTPSGNDGTASHNNSNNNNNNDKELSAPTGAALRMIIQNNNNKKKQKKEEHQQQHERTEWPIDQVWSKSKKKRMRALKSKQQQQPKQQQQQQHKQLNDNKDINAISSVGDSNNSNLLTKTKKDKKKKKKKKEKQTDHVGKTSPNQKSTSIEEDTSSSTKQEITTTTKNLESNIIKTNKQEQNVHNDTKLTSNSTASACTVIVPKNSNNNNNNTSTTATSSSNKYKDRLLGSRFRVLNEELYTTTSNVAYKKFQLHPELFEQYHNGFRYQVQDWPINPINIIVEKLKTYITTSSSKNKNNIISSTLSMTKQQQKLVIADFGCGEAQLAKELLSYKIKYKKESNNHKKKNKKNDNNPNHNSYYCPFVVHSFDLVSPNEYVTACDMANVPIPSNSVDIGIYCLSLMGTNIPDFIREAYRVIKDPPSNDNNNDNNSNNADGGSSSNSNTSSTSTGKLIIAEVRSRFETTPGNIDELNKFLTVLDKLGFHCMNIDRTNQLFMILELIKKPNVVVPSNNKKDDIIQFSAKPCIYKRR